MACRAEVDATDAVSAYDACFRDPADAATLVRMADLKAGDLVVSLDATAGVPTFTRVVLNQHTAESHVASLLKIETADGAAITVTPDHIIAIDGVFVPAREATVGASLSAGIIAKVTETTGGVINPVTVSGTILAADKHHSTPVLASTHPEWIASLFLNAPTFPFVATRLLAYLAPKGTQATYAAAEPSLLASLPTAQAVGAAFPAALPFGVLVADAAFATAVAMSTFAMPLSLGMPMMLFARK